MAVESQLSDQEIASLMEVSHPATGLGGSMEGGEIFARRLGSAPLGAREEDVMQGVVPCDPLDRPDAMIDDARTGALNPTRMS